MTETKPEYVAQDARPWAETLKLLGLSLVYADRLEELAEKHYRSITNELRWLIDEAYGKLVNRH